MARQSASDAARAFFQSIARAPHPDPIYYLHGQESYLLDRAVAQLIALAAPQGPNDFNYDAFHADGLSGARLRSAVETLPFMAKRRVVVVRDLQEIDLRELAALEEYFARPAETTCLILHAMTAQKSVDGRSGVIRKLKKAATVAEFAAFKPYETEKFVAKQARDRRMRFDDAALAYLTAAVGTSLAELDLALDRIDLYLGPSQEIRQVGREQVMEIIAETRAHSIFELTDALGAKDLQSALYILDQMLVAGDVPIVINQMIARHFRILSKLHDPTLRQAGRNEAAKAVGVSPFFLKDYRRHATHFSPQRVEQILDRLLEVDIALKSSKLDDRVHIERLMIGIAL